MTQPTSTVTGLARRFAVEIDTAAPGPAVWLPLIGIEEFKPNWGQRREADEDYDDAGAERQAVTGSNWNLELKVIHRSPDGGITFDSVQEYLRLKAQTDDALGGEVHVRWFDRHGGVEAYEGRALVSWAPDGGNGGARDTVAVVLSGQGKRAQIANPNASALPVISRLLPAGGPIAGGNIVTIQGRKFTGVTGVTFGATAATQVTLQADGQIACIAPAKAAGSYDITVTTPAGASANTAADNYTYA